MLGQAYQHTAFATVGWNNLDYQGTNATGSSNSGSRVKSVWPYSHPVLLRSSRGQPLREHLGREVVEVEVHWSWSGMSQHASLLALVLVWYGASIIAVASAKAILITAACPASLCAVQFAMATLGARHLYSRGSKSTSEQRLRLERPEYWHVSAIAASYAFGFLLTNSAISLAAPSFVETVKAAEPLTTVALAALALGEREKPVTLAALLPVVIGVAMASSSPSSFSGTGLGLALASNVAFSGRAVLTKTLKRLHPVARASSSDACLFYHVSRFGLCAMVPVAVLLDASGLLTKLVGGDSAGARLGLLLLTNGAAHALYNGVSFMVLNRVSVATHAVLNIVRRVGVIAFAAAAFGTHVSLFNWIGVAMATMGVAAFGFSKQTGGAASAAASTNSERAAGRQLLLPYSMREVEHHLRSV
jgi:solute carrier family 35 protein E1